MRLSRSIVALGACAALLGAAPASADARSWPSGCRAGAPGLGDPYYPTYGNGGYDVRRYHLAIAYDPATDRLEGTASIRARATQRLCSFNLDLVGLEVAEVTVDGRRAQWRREGQELIITPQRRLRRGRFDVVVRYGGVPVPFPLFPGSDLPMGFIHTADGAVVLGQPESATSWFPVNDHPLDEARYSFDVTVPAGYEVVANGHLRGVDTGAGGATTWRWRATEPMASYLTTIDIGFWDVTEWRTERGIPVYDAVDSAITGPLRAVIDTDLARQGDILAMLSDTFGPYPFDTVGAIVDDDPRLAFALETQTRPVYAKAFWLDQDDNPQSNEFVLVHELAHQWFGDDLALARWQDIWLNEGFATYAEWLWAEHEGLATAAEIFRFVHDAIPADDAFWSVVIGDPGVELLFDGAVYERGAMTLQALREEVGDETFFAIVRGWAESRAGGNVTTPEFIAHAERVAGRQLDALFDAWLFTPGRPALPAAAARSAAGAGLDVARLLAAPHRHMKR